MSLDILIGYYKDIKIFEPTAEQAKNNVRTARETAQTLAKEIEKKKKELAQLQQEEQVLKNQLEQEMETLEKIKREQQESAIRPGRSGR